MSFRKPGFAILSSNLIQGVMSAVIASLAWSVPLLVGTPSVRAQESAVISAQPDNNEWVQAWINDLSQSSQQWIEIDLSDQRLTAWEGDVPVFSITVSTGRASDMTPTGVYEIQSKYRTARMQGEHEGKSYDIPDVPYTMYFSGGYAIHGAYWHDNFGTPVSSGCINVPVDGAAWLFDWAGEGTAVVVQN